MALETPGCPAANALPPLASRFLKVAELQDSLLKEKDEVKLLQEEKILLLEGNQARPWWKFWG